VTVLGMGSPGPQPAGPTTARVVQVRTTRSSVAVDLMSKLTPMMPVSLGR